MSPGSQCPLGRRDQGFQGPALINFAEEAGTPSARGHGDARSATGSSATSSRYWQSQVKRGQRRCSMARTELHRRQLSQSNSDAVSDTEQKEALREAQRKLRKAEEQVEKIKQWVPVFDHAISEYHSQSQPLGDRLSGGFALARRPEPDGRPPSSRTWRWPPPRPPAPSRPRRPGATAPRGPFPGRRGCRPRATDSAAIKGRPPAHEKPAEAEEAPEVRPNGGGAPRLDPAPRTAGSSRSRGDPLSEQSGTPGPIE